MRLHGNGQFADCAASRETFHAATKPLALIWCFAGRKRPWNEGCGQLARIDTAVSAPSGAIASASEPPSSRLKVKSNFCDRERSRPANEACNPPAMGASPEPGASG